MAGEIATPSVNGIYGAQPPYAAAEAFTQPISNPTINGQINGQGNATTTSSTSEASSPSKDEVGWYFVEQYYTNLSKSPEKLHLFYAKRSQFVSGVEAEKVSVSVGQRAIGERIKEMDIQDCKVRVTNVDSQESGRDIVVQVIGEMSNKSAPHRKFVQTFVLAEQPNGYFVLNDIFRYIAEEEEEEEDEEEEEIVGPVAPELETVDHHAQEPEPHTLTGSDNLVALEKDANIVDKKLEQTTAESKDEPEAESTTDNGTSVVEPESAEETQAEEFPVETTTTEAVQEAEKLAAEESFMPEAPKDPEPTPAPGSPKQFKAAPVPAPAQESAAPSKPAAPRSWASMAAASIIPANKAPTPAVPSIPSNTSTPPQPKGLSQSTPAPVSTAPAAADDSQGLPSPGGWQTAGQEHSRKQGRQQSGSVSGGTNEKGGVLGYIKNVTERVDASVLKSTLIKFGKLEYFDVSRPKNCAFIEFADAASLVAAMAASPLQIGGEDIYVEERRPRANAYGGGFNARGSMRGGRGGLDGRSPSHGGRGNYPKDGRGGFVPRGRGGSMTPRGGRGMPQAA